MQACRIRHLRLIKGTPVRGSTEHSVYFRIIFQLKEGCTQARSVRRHLAVETLLHSVLTVCDRLFYALLTAASVQYPLPEQCTEDLTDC